MKSISDFLALTERAIDPLVLPCAILCGLILAAVALSFIALTRAKTLIRASDHRAMAAQQRSQDTLTVLQDSLNSLAAEMQEIRHQPPLMVAPSSLRPGLNLSKRSQALRMHRRGDAPDRISAALDIPVQEVDLLMKVSRILISNI
jgi:hypothetical protein